MDDHADFDSVSWRNESESNEPRQDAPAPSQETILPTRISNGKRRPSSQHQHHEPQAGHLAQPVDLGGIGDGVLECTVDSPLKENDGTKDAYVSYLINTTVGLSFWSRLVDSFLSTNRRLAFRPISNHFRNPNSLSEGASQISSSCGRPFIANTQHAQYPHYLRRITWRMCEEIVSALTSCKGEHGHCTASSRGYPYILCSVEHLSLYYF
jgi:hypothetical protein